MKNFLYILVAVFIFSGCSKDDKVDAASNNKNISIGGKNYSFEGAGVIDYGYDSDDEEYTKEFIITSTPITTGKGIKDYSYSLYFQANVAHNEFAYGTFGEDDSKDQSGGVIFVENGSYVFMTSGSFTISKESNGDLKIDLDGVLMDGKQLKGTYIAPFGTLTEEFVENLIEINVAKSSSFRIKG